MKSSCETWDFYRQQTLITSPGRYLEALKTVPVFLPELVESVGNLVLGFVSGRTLIPAALFAQRMHQVDLRTVEAMLEALLTLCDLPFSVLRQPEQRIVGNCRDSAVLCASVFRLHNQPARVRYGISRRYYSPQEDFHEHAVTEVFQERWCTIDCRITSENVARWNLSLKPGEPIEEGLFIPALEAWRQCRANERDFSDFSGDKKDSAYGMWALVKLVYMDIASLNGFEPLVWDAWGPPLYRTAPCALEDPEELACLDRFASYALECPQAWAEMRLFFQEQEAFHIPQILWSYSPCGMRQWSLPFGQNFSQETRHYA